MKRFKILILIMLAGLMTAIGCEKKIIDSIYTNPDAIVDRLRTDGAAREANDPDFILTEEIFTFDEALAGTFETTGYMLELDSNVITYDVVVGDTVEVDNLRAKEANVKIRNKIYYSLTLENGMDTPLVKHLKTNPSRAYKRAYMLQLGNFHEIYRGWVFYGTSVLFNLADGQPVISWRSRELGNLDASDGIIFKRDYPAFNPGDSITVEYIGHLDDIAFLTINEDGDPRKIEFERISDNIREAGWTISEGNSEVSHYYYAGIEIYRHETLASADTTDTDFFFSGLMYSIDTE
jgi:hypothetical protein